jgi:hypothetical protein
MIDDHESLGVDQNQAPKAQTSTHDAGSSSTMSQLWEGVLS